MDILRTAWRNVWRNSRRSGVTIAAMALALYVLIVYAGLLGGYLRDMELNVVELEKGDLQIAPLGYREDPDLHTRLTSVDDIVGPLRAAGYEASPRLLARGLVAAEESSAGVEFRGIELDVDATVSRVHEHLAAGTWLDPAVPDGVVIGYRLSRMLGAGPGAELVVITQGLDGAMAYELVRVSGVLGSIGDATDMGGVFMLADSLRSLVGVKEGVHQIVVRRPVDVTLQEAASDALRMAPGTEVQTWRQLNPTLASLLDSSQQASSAMYVVVYAAVAILVLNAMLMAAFERIREIGVLKALGVSPAQVFAMMSCEAAFQAGLAIVIGVAAGVPTLLYFARSGLDVAGLGGVSVVGMAMPQIWYAEAGPGSYSGPIAALIVIVALAVLFPAVKAARIEPVSALHHR